MLRLLHRDERGVALVMSLMVAFVVLLLSIVVVQQAVHSLDGSGNDRRRLNSINAAEAGVDFFFHHLEQTEVGDLQTGTYTGDLGSGPAPVEFTVTPTYYSDPEGTVPLTGAMTDTNYPRSVKITSEGVSADGLMRRMESFVQLTPVYGGFEGAMISNSAMSLTNNFTLGGNAGNDGDIYVLNGNFTAPSGIESIRGSIYVVAGSASLSTNMRVYGHVWANGGATTSHSQAQIDGYVRSSTAGVTLTQGSVGGSAYYCTTITNANKAAGGGIQECTTAPPSKPFPQIRYDAAAWQAQGYTIYEVPGTDTTQCDNARNYIQGTTDGTFKSGDGVSSDYSGVVVYISGTCTLSVSNNAIITLKKDLAIVTRGGINLNNRNTWTGSGGTKNLHFISPYPDSGSPSCPTQNVGIQNNPDFVSVEVAVYSPCTLSVSNNSASFNGQLIGATLNVTNRFAMNYRPVLIPGSNIDGFRQDVAYVREVTV